MAKSPAAEVEASLLAHLNSASEVPDSRSYASSLGVSHAELESVIKSLSAFRIVESTVRSASSPSISRNKWFIPDPETWHHLAFPQDITKETWVLTEEAKGYAARGSPEAQLVAAIPPEGAAKDALKVRFL
jgi:phenylalanyl-tRNA synthetase alpha chain